ncbi:MAG TPA: hypothetical protein VEW69_06695, partial [Alphaproteobacteria bacterium]|nr:hypothetical protein [Alphaproteobacteria bacterium]
GAIGAVANRDAIFGYSWHQYTSPDGKFSVELPGKPVWEPKTITRTDGTNVTYHHVKAQPAARSYYSVAYYDRGSAEADAILDRIQSGTLKAVQGTLISMKPITLNGLPGRELQMSTPKGVTLTEHIVVDAERYYMLVVSTERSQSTESKDAQHFFDSFKLLG